MIQKYKIILLIFFIVNLSFSQISKNRDRPKLETESFTYLEEQANSEANDSIAKKQFADAWLSKASAAKNYSQIAKALKTVMYISSRKLHLLYADRMVKSALISNNNTLIGAAYLTKATVYYGRKQHKEALDNFMLADKYISQTKENYSIYKVKYGIAQTKYYLGFYDEAIALFRECIDYFKEENDRAYLNSLHQLGLCYNRTGNYAWCSLTNQIGIDEGKRIDNLDMQFYFRHSEGINQCCRKNYREGIKILKHVLPELIKYRDFANVSVAYFYIGKSLWSLGQKQESIPYLKNVDSIFVKEKYIKPDLRIAYEMLITYYMDNDDLKSQLFYTSQLLKVNQVLAQKHNYLLTKIVKEFDTKELMQSQIDLHNTMNIRTYFGLGVIILLIMIISYLIFKHFKNRRIFNEIIKRDRTKIQPDKNLLTNINPDIEDNVLKLLQKFESDKSFLEKEMSLSRMAVLLNTNTKYVTKIVARHKGKGTLEYVADLKVEYIIDLLIRESKYRNYTNKALAEEVGFGSTQKFTRAFKNREDMSPTIFINILKKSLIKVDSK